MLHERQVERLVRSHRWCRFYSLGLGSRSIEQLPPGAESRALRELFERGMYSEPAGLVDDGQHPERVEAELQRLGIIAEGCDFAAEPRGNQFGDEVRRTRAGLGR
jgi:hypothetical protein